MAGRIESVADPAFDAEAEGVVGHEAGRFHGAVGDGGGGAAGGPLGDGGALVRAAVGGDDGVAHDAERDGADEPWRRRAAHGGGARAGALDGGGELKLGEAAEGEADGVSVADAWWPLGESDDHSVGTSTRCEGAAN